MGACFGALIEGVLMAPLDSRYTQVGFNSISVQVCPYELVKKEDLCKNMQTVFDGFHGSLGFQVHSSWIQSYLCAISVILQFSKRNELVNVYLFTVTVVFRQ